jgi:glycosyltransferase involved in cell wall biosynthesis
MKNNELISIIMPCYNAEKYIDITLQSVINQSYKNWELIAIDDNSTDNTAFIIKNLSLKDNRIILYKNEFNLGYTKNVNKAFRFVKGQYCVKFDDDDLMKFNFLEKLFNCLNEDKTLGHVTAANNPTIDEDGNEILSACPSWINEFSNYFEIDLMSTSIIKFPSTYISRFFLTNYALGGLTGTMFRVSDAKKIGFFDERYEWAPDFDFTLKLSSLASYKGFYMEPIWSYRRLPYSLTTKSKNEGVIHLELNYLIERVFELFQNNLTKNEKDAGIKKWLNHSIKHNLKYANRSTLLNMPPYIYELLSVRQKSVNLLNEVITKIRNV